MYQICLTLLRICLSYKMVPILYCLKNEDISHYYCIYNEAFNIFSLLVQFLEKLTRTLSPLDCLQ